MQDGDSQSRIERLKTIYRDFFAEFLSLRKRKDRILESYENQLDQEEQARLRRKLEPPSV